MRLSRRGYHCHKEQGREGVIMDTHLHGKYSIADFRCCVCKTTILMISTRKQKEEMHRYPFSWQKGAPHPEKLFAR